MRISKVIIVSGVLGLLLLSSVAIGYAQDEEGFIRQVQLSRRDVLILSAIYPGLGQMNSGQRIKGVTMFFMETVALVTAINSSENYTTKEKIYNNDLSDFNKIGLGGRGEYSDIIEQYNDLKDRSSELDDLNTVRNVALITAGVVYAYNIFDALFRGPHSGTANADSSPDRVRVQSALIDHTPGILLSKSF
ncbi:DUF5683 domain-containing protein [Candidatus Latescibacterota bacterium]